MFDCFFQIIENFIDSFQRFQSLYAKRLCFVLLLFNPFD